MASLKCIVCGVNLSNFVNSENVATSTTNNKIWIVFCDYFDLSFSSFKDDEKFNGTSGHNMINSFCDKCTYSLTELCILKEQLESIQSKISNIITNLSITIRKSLHSTPKSFNCDDGPVAGTSKRNCFNEHLQRLQKKSNHNDDDGNLKEFRKKRTKVDVDDTALRKIICSRYQAQLTLLTDNKRKLTKRQSLSNEAASHPQLSDSTLSDDDDDDDDDDEGNWRPRLNSEESSILLDHSKWLTSDSELESTFSCDNEETTFEKQHYFLDQLPQVSTSVSICSGGSSNDVSNLSTEDEAFESENEENSSSTTTTTNEAIRGVQNLHLIRQHGGHTNYEDDSMTIISSDFDDRVEQDDDELLRFINVYYGGGGGGNNNNNDDEEDDSMTIINSDNESEISLMTVIESNQYTSGQMTIANSDDESDDDDVMGSICCEDEEMIEAESSSIGNNNHGRSTFVPINSCMILSVQPLGF